MGFFFKLCSVFLFLIPLNSQAGIPDGVDSSGTPILSSKNGYVEPFKIADNVYYIGDRWVSSYLVATHKGLVVIDSLDSPFGRWLPINIKKLGFSPDAVRYLIITHGHSDHVGGAGYIEETFGAEVLISEAALTLAQQQSKGAKDGMHFFPPKNPQLITKGMTLALGEATFIFHRTPGHTPGAYSVEFEALFGGKRHRALVYGGMGTNFSGQQQAQAYIDSVKRMQASNAQLRPFEVNLASHPHLATLFERRDSAVRTGLRAAYVDTDGINQFLTLLGARGEKKLKQELKTVSQP